MTARRYTIRLYRRGVRQLDAESNLDPRDDRLLRATLEQFVRGKAGTLDLDLSQWSMQVRVPRGRWVARVKVAASGATVIQR